MSGPTTFPGMPDFPCPTPVFLNLLTDHFGTEAATLPILTEEFDRSEQANVQLALDAYLEPEGRNAQLIGIGGEHKRHRGLGLADLLVVPRGGPMGSSPPRRGTGRICQHRADEGRVLPAVQSGLYLWKTPGRSCVALRSGPANTRRSRRCASR
ncbi:MAG: hypothetical protein R2849_14400 [Thermomicrobiales bacterium]